MTKQGDLFRSMCATVRTAQPELFEVGGRSSALRCEQCGEHLEHTASGFIACPRGHGKLMDPHTVAWRAQARQDDDQGEPVDTWPDDARRIAARHRDSARYLAEPWTCECAACRQDRTADR